MNHFNMDSPTSTPPSECRFHGELVIDHDGRLYDRRIREVLGRGRPFRERKEMAGIEALAALRIAARTMRQQMDRFAERHDLSEGRLLLLFQLGRADNHELPLGELATHLDVSPRNVTGLIDHLERDGLVERVHDTADRRSIQARLTAAGLEKVDALWQHARDGQLALVTDFSAEELATLRHLTLRLVKKMTGASVGAEKGSRA